MSNLAPALAAATTPEALVELRYSKGRKADKVRTVESYWDKESHVLNVNGYHISPLIQAAATLKMLRDCNAQEALLSQGILDSKMEYLLDSNAKIEKTIISKTSSVSSREILDRQLSLLWRGEISKKLIENYSNLLASQALPTDMCVEFARELVRFANAEEKALYSRVKANEDEFNMVQGIVAEHVKVLESRGNFIKIAFIKKGELEQLIGVILANGYRLHLVNGGRPEMDEEGVGFYSGYMYPQAVWATPEPEPATPVAATPADKPVEAQKPTNKRISK